MAEYHFEQARSINRMSGVLVTYVGMVLLAQNRPEDALRMLDELLAMKPFNPQACFLKANCLFQMEEKLQSYSHSAMTSELELRARSRTLIERAIVELQKVCDYSPKEVVVHTTMAKYLKRLGRLDEAMHHYTTALDISPKKGSRIKANIENLHSNDDLDDESIKEIQM